MKEKEKYPKYLATLVFVGFFAICWSIANVAIEAKLSNFDAGLIGMIIGHWANSFGAVISYYFGSSSGSEDKNAAIHEAIKNKKEDETK